MQNACISLFYKHWNLKSLGALLKYIIYLFICLHITCIMMLQIFHTGPTWKKEEKINSITFDPPYYTIPKNRQLITHLKLY